MKAQKVWCERSYLLVSFWGEESKLQEPKSLIDPTRNLQSRE